MSEFVIVSGCADNWFYMRFASKDVADAFVGLCLDAGLGSAYPNGGWCDSSCNTGAVTKNTTLVTEEMFYTLEEAVAEVSESDASDLIGDFEGEHGWDDEEEENGDPY